MQKHTNSKNKVKQDLETEDDKLHIQSSLPPQVKGEVQCFLAVTVDEIKWRVDNYPKDIQVCLQWWGETGDGTMFWPLNGKKSSSFQTSSNTFMFPVCSGPKQFAAYLKDMNVLVLDVLHAKSKKPFGRVEIFDIVEINNPIDRWYPVTSRSVQPMVFADLHVVLKFEPIDVIGQELPTVATDSGFTHPTDNQSEKHELENIKNKTNVSGDMQKNGDANENDVIISLIKRGEILRNSIIESTAGIEVKEENSELMTQQEERSVPGSLFKEILEFHEEGNLVKSDISFAAGDDDIELYESTTSIESDSDDLIHDETLLQDLFYVNQEVSALNESRRSVDVEKIENESLNENNGNNTIERKPSFIESRSQGIVGATTEKNNVNHECHTFLNKLPVSGHGLNKDFLTQLGVNKLTALGRVTSARLHINKLNVFDELEIDKHNKRTYFIEYEFPVAAADRGFGQSDKNDIGLEITRIATKKTSGQSIVFNHHSVFPVHFDSTVIRFWYDCSLKINVFERKSGQKSPILCGYGKIDLLNVLTSQHLQYEKMVKIKACNKQRSSSMLGELEIKMNLMSNGKDLNYFSPEKQNISDEKENISDEKETVSHETRVENDIIPEIKEAQRIETEQKQVHINRNEKTTNRRHCVPLTTMLWVSKGRNIISPGHGVRVSVPGSLTRSNFYLISRMFWTTDISRSSISWGQNDPKFDFRQIFPVLLTPALLDRMHNNFLTLEVWSKTGGTQEDQLVGIAKLPLQQLYLSFKEENTTKALLKSKFPVVGVDGWINIGNPFKSTSHGELYVLLAMGSENQINRLLDIKQCSDEPDHFKTKDRLQNDFNISSKHSGEKHVEHWFEISVQNVRKLVAFENTSLAETDCFVQYNFPYQKPDVVVDVSANLSQDVPGLQNHRTATTMCAPDTVFNDVARYHVVLPRTLPVQRFLLAAYHGSWSSMSSAAVTFELWKRYYYPNIRDQLVAKAVLPLSKLCGMITMQRPCESSIQSFSLPLTLLANESKKSDLQGLLDITIKYRQSKLMIPQTHRVNTADMNTQVCLAIEVIRACGLKSALSEIAKKDPSLTHVSEVGGNPFVKIKLPFNIKVNERTTRTIAKTFTPEFGYRMEFILPLVLTDNMIGRDSEEFSGTLAECLEFGEVVFEIWHQRLEEHYEMKGEEILVGQSFYHRQLPPSTDVLIGVVKIPLQQLLFSHTGIRGWFPVKSHCLGWSSEDDTRNSLDKTVGGLEIIINLSESTAREKIIESGRAVGWCLPLWYELEDGEWLNDTANTMNVGQGLSCLVNIKKVWIPKTAVVQTRQPSSQRIGCYIRYKFYDTKAVFSSISGVKKIKESNVTICDLNHRHSYIIKTTSPFIWYIREERLEIQVWLTVRHDDTLPHKRDRLLGSAFIPLFPLLDGSKNVSQISGLYPLFRSGAVDLYGAGLHVQMVLQKPSNTNQTFGNAVDEDIASTEPSESALNEKDTIVSSDECKHDVEKYRPQEISSPCEDDVITAHVVIEKALHLSFVKTHQNRSVEPNVYVTYQLNPDVKVIKTKIIHSSCSPVWEHEKIIKFNKAMIGKQILTFKVWHYRGESGKDEKSDEDLFLGVASVDLSPLTSGLRQVIGWYNIVDFSARCQGQIKVGVVPLLSVSPERNLFPQVNYNLSSTERKQDTLEPLKILSTQASTSDTMSNSTLIEVPNTSKSFLLRQLRQNLNDLDVMRCKLNERLTGGKNNTSLVNKTSLDCQKYSVGTHHEPAKKDENILGSLITSSANDNDFLLERNTNVPVIQDRISDKLNIERHPKSHRPSIDSNEGNNLNYQYKDSRDFNVHDVNMEEPSFTKCYTNDNDERSSVDTGSLIYDHDGNNHVHNDDEHDDNDDDHGDNDNDLSKNDNDHGDNDDNYSDNDNDLGNNDNNHGDNDNNHSDNDHGNNDNDHGDTDNDRHNYGNNDDDHGDKDCIDVLDPTQFINDIINDPINDNLPGNRSTDLAGFTKNGHFGPTDVINESQLRTSSFDITHKTVDRSYVGDPVDSADESLDSFFDCVTLKQRSEPGVKPPDVNDVVQPHSVVSRRNLSKLKNIHERMSGDEQKLSLSEPQNNNLNIKNGESIHLCGNKKDRKLSLESAVKEAEIDHHQLSKPTFQENNTFGTSLQKALIPNFFMPPKDLEQSMRSLRLAATFRKKPRQDNENEREKLMQDDATFRIKGKVLAKSFVDWKKLEEMKTTGRVLLTSDETSRLARIFSSNYSTKK